ncbi:host attachment protein [Cereibacter azotoformans]|uniref:Protein required for attachment to host cells n=1 Tax=Cereibacter azotoformans TaxID=43057 RepID=A0A2T5K5U4_9RHOB|nr:host attachment protein [Cereibacter azotoformans]AXQ95576.1 host attachment protein [Cereibacter sphaeroides]PTR17762.1 protein required for attachment to host cells [Cereibacter azotoformans]UIJ32179.1 host attachment protein [Cereibacter azotoformans]
MMVREEDTWALVLDSTRARILRGLPRRGPPSTAELVLKCESHKLRDLMSDKPGRSFASFGGGRRSAMEYGSDPLMEDERTFLREVVAVLETHRRAGEVHQLVIFAEPHSLGLMRTMLPPALRRLVRCEMPLNLIHVSAHELPQVILGYLGRKM